MPQHTKLGLTNDSLSINPVETCVSKIGTQLFPKILRCTSREGTLYVERCEAKMEIGNKVLSMEFKRRKMRNANYSLRAFARDLGMSPGAISEVIRGKRPLTQRAIKRLVDAPGLSQVLLNSSQMNQGAHETFLELEKFEAISGWEHFAILNLIKTKDFRSDLAWIAKRLNIKVVIVRKAVERLKTLNLIAVDDKGQFSRTKERLTTPNNISSAALREAHLEELGQIRHAINNIEVDFLVLPGSHG